jgi:HSP20 family molecular chaperone IbpA
MATNTTEVATQESTGGSLQRSERAAGAAIRPPVDIYEDGDGITLHADLPGVSKDRLNVRVENQSLVIEGDVHFDLPQEAEALYADVRSSVYRRSFALSGELETEKIEANLKDGVLTVHIPKRAELRPRRIEIQAH